MKTRALFAKIASLGLLGVGLMSQVVWAQGNGGGQPSFVPGRILVKFKDGVSDGQARVLLAGRGALSTDVIPQIGVHIVQLPPNANEQAEANAFKGLAEVEFAELDQIVAPSGITPNDQYYPSQWALPDISLPNAWSVTTGTSSVVLAILDTGVTPVADLPSTKLVMGCDTFDDPNCLNPSTSIPDVNGHGTQTAATAAAIGNNAIGIASPCWSCSIMPVRVTDSSGNAWVSATATGLNWAASHGAKVAYVGFALMSSPTVVSAAQNFYNHGGVVIMPVGNNTGMDSNSNSPYVIVVSAVNSNNVLDPSSAYGYDVDLAAPITVITQSANGAYIQASGTSFSAALAAGVAGLILSVKPCLSPAQVSSVFQQSATPLGVAVYYGWGLVNASAAVTLAGTTTCTSGTSPPAITSSLTASGTVSTAFGYQITATNSPTSFGASGLPSGLTVNTTTGLISGTPSVSGSFSVTLSATNSGGTGTAILALSISSASVSPPAITSSLTAAGTQNSAFSYQITATNSPTSFGASGLPSGLSVNTTTGLISGTPSVSGSFNVTISATNSRGTGSAILVLTINTQSTADKTPPTAPTNLTALTAPGQVTLAWTASTDNVGVIGYRVYRAKGNGKSNNFSTPSLIGTPSTTSYKDSSVNSGTIYQYYVTAFDAAGNVSAASNTITVTAP